MFASLRRSVVVAAVLAAVGTGLAAPAASAAERSGSAPRAPLAALGDSYSSGEGAPPFDPATLPCDRSPLAWPVLVGEALGRPTVNLACSGAHTQDVTNPYNRQPAQTAALAALRPRPKIVTITIGGNDAGFGTVLGLCAATPAAGPQDCTQAVAAAEAFMVTQLPDRLADTYRAVEAADPRARLVVVGYPRLVPATDAQVTSCSWLSSNERQALNQAADLLNLVIRIEAYLAHATYVDVSRAVRGHELCTADPWIVPIGSTTAPRSSWAHPNPQGQQAIASRVLDVLEK